MCRNIKPLFNFAPPATEEEIHAAALQFVRKISGFQKVSKVNEEVFNKSVEEITKNIEKLLTNLKTDSEKRNREAENEKARQQSIKRFKKFK